MNVIKGTVKALAAFWAASTIAGAQRTSLPVTRFPTPPETGHPSLSPTTDIPTFSPSASIPTISPFSSEPSLRPTTLPSWSPSRIPTSGPSQGPSSIPSQDPTSSQPSLRPTESPSRGPVFSPPTTAPATLDPTRKPTSSRPSEAPSVSVETVVDSINKFNNTAGTGFFNATQENTLLQSMAHNGFYDFEAAKAGDQDNINALREIIGGLFGRFTELSAQTQAPSSHPAEKTGSPTFGIDATKAPNPSAPARQPSQQPSLAPSGLDETSEYVFIRLKGVFNGAQYAAMDAAEKGYAIGRIVGNLGLDTTIELMEYFCGDLNAIVNAPDVTQDIKDKFSLEDGPVDQCIDFESVLRTEYPTAFPTVAPTLNGTSNSTENFTEQSVFNGYSAGELGGSSAGTAAVGSVLGALGVMAASKAASLTFRDKMKNLFTNLVINEVGGNATKIALIDQKKKFVEATKRSLEGEFVNEDHMIAALKTIQKYIQSTNHEFVASDSISPKSSLDQKHFEVDRVFDNIRANKRGDLTLNALDSAQEIGTSRNAVVAAVRAPTKIVGGLSSVVATPTNAVFRQRVKNLFMDLENIVLHGSTDLIDATAVAAVAAKNALSAAQLVFREGTNPKANEFETDRHAVHALRTLQEYIHSKDNTFVVSINDQSSVNQKHQELDRVLVDLKKNTKVGENFEKHGLVLKPTPADRQIGLFTRGVTALLTASTHEKG
ncbi:MAG: hypothetical protein ACJAZX_000227 [Rickettsiales bacterium]|jgi:hypothetical protein